MSYRLLLGCQCLHNHMLTVERAVGEVMNVTVVLSLNYIVNVLSLQCTVCLIGPDHYSFQCHIDRYIWFKDSVLLVT